MEMYTAQKRGTLNRQQKHNIAINIFNKGSNYVCLKRWVNI